MTKNRHKMAQISKRNLSSKGKVLRWHHYTSFQIYQSKNPILSYASLLPLLMSRLSCASVPPRCEWIPTFRHNGAAARHRWNPTRWAACLHWVWCNVRSLMEKSLHPGKWFTRRNMLDSGALKKMFQYIVYILYKHMRLVGMRIVWELNLKLSFEGFRVGFIGQFHSISMFCSIHLGGCFERGGLFVRLLKLLKVGLGLGNPIRLPGVGKGCFFMSVACWSGLRH